ncbi:peptidoglycan-binding protein LysM [Flavobacterium sp. FlaQc-47]|uniref:peptidoglycan-binding protein LysM n=1 Tax=Flavobacterium sp. FlaQc-47 TaxID=3374180 RepID=UPI003757AE3B
MYYIDDSEGQSKDKHLTYKIRKGDTLQSVATELGVDAYELRRYHNIHCAIPDLIEADFKSYLEFLILSPKKSAVSTEAEEKRPQKVSLGNNYKLPFLPGGIKKKYKVHYTTEVGEEIDTLEMNVSVKWLATDKNNFHLFEIKRKSIYVNNEIPDTVMDQLAAKTAEVIYPLKIVVDESGKWVAIYNFDDIESRWKATKKEILDYYEGEVTENYIDHAENALENEVTLFKYLSSDYFLRTFFNGIHVGYTADYTFKNDVFFPLEKEEESMFNVEQKINPFLDESYCIKVEQEGDFKDLAAEFNYGLDPWTGKFNATYLLDSDSYCVEKINLECSMDYDDPIKVTIAIEALKKGQH